MSIKAKLSCLELVFPPISSSEAVSLENEPAVVRRMRMSDFYMIAGKPQGLFTNISIDNRRSIIRFDYSVENKIVDSGKIDIKKLHCLNDREGAFGVVTKERRIDIVQVDGNGKPSSVIERFTPEGILWHKSRHTAGISGLNRYKELSDYDLLYVGIAKVGDTYDRLIANGHKAKMDILAKEPQRYSGDRVSDEIFLFMFKVEPLFISVFSIDDDMTEENIFPTHDLKRIVADAEKAFVSLLKPEYNSVKFKNYPKGADGLYGIGLDRYSYSIGEFFSFNTAYGKISGGRSLSNSGVTNSADYILVDGNDVTVYISGKDFQSRDF